MRLTAGSLALDGRMYGHSEHAWNPPSDANINKGMGALCTDHNLTTTHILHYIHSYFHSYDK